MTVTFTTWGFMDSDQSGKKIYRDQKEPMTLKEIWMMMEEIEPLTPLCSRTETSLQSHQDH